MSLSTRRHSGPSMTLDDPLGTVLGAVWALGSLTCFALLSLLAHNNDGEHSLSQGPIASVPELASPEQVAETQR